jgi:hypothetical protein
VPLVPVCGAVVTFLALRRAERRGEMLALESIGCSPARASACAVAAAIALGVIAATSVAFFRGPSLDAFFPRASAHGDVRPDGDAFVDGARGIRIDRDGDMTREKKEGPAISPAASGRAASAAILTALLALALPLVSARALRRERAVPFAVAAGTCASCIFLAQAAAAGRAPAALACVPAAALLVYATVRYRSPAW